MAMAPLQPAEEVCVSELEDEEIVVQGMTSWRT